MEAYNEKEEPTPSDCPYSYGLVSVNRLDADQELVFPEHKRVFHQYSADSSGTTELHLWFGEKEIVFDEPELFDFGEQLIKQRSFTANQATQWGHGYEWPRVRDLFEQLIAEEVLFPASAVDSEECPVSADKASSNLPAAQCRKPRTWLECEAITRELTDQAIGVGYLEMIVPIFRVAHIAMDSEGRQVGEANVFPRPLRLEVETDWRICRHSGSRYLNEKPMNVSAVKAMRKHWSQMMAVLAKIREAYLARFPNIRSAWTVGDLERLSSVVLALPAYLLMSHEHPVPNGKLHPVFSNIFRVTDGLRLTMHQMLFLPTLEPTISPDAPISSAEIYAYVERNHGFISEYGVCAGPRGMIEEFLRLMVDGQSTQEFGSVALDPEVEQGLAELQNAIDYGLFGLQVYAQVFSHWPAMARAYEELWSVLENWSGEQSNFFRHFRDRFAQHIDGLRSRSLLRNEEWRASRDIAYADMYENSALGLGKRCPAQKLVDRIAPGRGNDPIDSCNRLRTILSQRLFGTDAALSPDLDRFVAAFMEFLRIEQAIVRAACATQDSINALLGRARPIRAFDALDFDAYNQLLGEVQRLPCLLHEFENEFAMNISVTADRILFSERTDT